MRKETKEYFSNILKYMLVGAASVAGAFLFLVFIIYCLLVEYSAGGEIW